jgi:hypothetical protein
VLLLRGSFVLLFSLGGRDACTGRMNQSATARTAPAYPPANHISVNPIRGAARPDSPSPAASNAEEVLVSASTQRVRVEAMELSLLLIVIGIALAILVSYALGIACILIGLVLLIWPRVRASRGTRI